MRRGRPGRRSRSAGRRRSPRTAMPSSSRRIRSPMPAGGASPCSVTVRSPSLPCRTSFNGRPGPRVERTVSKASCESIGAPSTDTIWSPAAHARPGGGGVGVDDSGRGTRAAGSPRRRRASCRASPTQTGRTSPKRSRSSTMRSRAVDRDREADALRAADDRRGDADHVAVDVDERAARVAGIDRGVGLDEVGVGAVVLALDAPADGGDDARRDRVREAERVADRDRSSRRSSGRRRCRA